MDSFLDSNVVLNYIFDLDRGHSESEDIIFKSTSYYSSNVKNEVEDLFIRKNKEYKSFILRVDAFINKFSDYDVVNDNYVHGFINNMRPIGKFKVNDMHYAFDKIWEKFGFDESHDAFELNYHDL